MTLPQYKASKLVAKRTTQYLQQDSYLIPQVLDCNDNPVFSNDWILFNNNNKIIIMNFKELLVGNGNMSQFLAHKENKNYYSNKPTDYGYKVEFSLKRQHNTIGWVSKNYNFIPSWDMFHYILSGLTAYTYSMESVKALVAKNFKTKALKILVAYNTNAKIISLPITKITDQSILNHLNQL